MGLKDEIIAKLPSNVKISNAKYEGANVVLYTSDKDFLINNGGEIRKLVDTFKKRIEVRADSKLLAPVTEVEKEVMNIMPKNAEITQVLMEPARSLVIIESKSPGNAIGKDGENLKKIKSKLRWTPVVRRDSAIPSKITQNIRRLLHEDSVGRKKFLNGVGERIYETRRSSGVGEKWVRITFMGAARQVGRSCFLLQTPESNVMIDCGIGFSESSAYPIINLPEFDIAALDAVITCSP